MEIDVRQNQIGEKIYFHKIDDFSKYSCYRDDGENDSDRDTDSGNDTDIDSVFDDNDLGLDGI